MAYEFAEDWAQEVADISTLPEYQTCQIEIRNPDLLVRTGTIETGYTWTGDPVIWSGQARVKGIRAALDLQAGTTANPSGSKSVRVQIPYNAYPNRINRGWQIRVTFGGRNSVLEQYLLTVESDFNPGNEAAQTIECSIALDNDPGWPA